MSLFWGVHFFIVSLRPIRMIRVWSVVVSCGCVMVGFYGRKLCGILYRVGTLFRGVVDKLCTCLDTI